MFWGIHVKVSVVKGKKYQYNLACSSIGLPALTVKFFKGSPLAPIILVSPIEGWANMGWTEISMTKIKIKYKDINFNLIYLPLKGPILKKREEKNN